MKISIITVSYNAVTTIEETINSVLNQSYQNIEYVIIDGSSSDGTQAIIEKYADRIAYCISEPDGGIYLGMNKGIDACTGDYIGILNADDVQRLKLYMAIWNMCLSRTLMMLCGSGIQAVLITINF